jgi:homopolymeric O-antigen transport system ATP-binding protein
MTYPAVRVEDLWKEYVIGARQKQAETFREMVARSFASPFRRLRRLHGQAPAEERLWALRGVTFDIREGEAVGIIGRNGAGKTTLLKALSRITAPTRGRIHLRGRVASLLEVGTGFHPELTGRENIYLNGAILGMSRGEIQRKFEAIVDFSGVEMFLDTPVKRYSSGMYVRLAFAVAAHLEPDILLIDEVLAVGDMQFQQKCLGKLGDASKEGRTILFVSHNMGAVSRFCESGIVIRDGRSTYYPSAAEAIRSYSKDISSERDFRKSDFSGALTPKLKFSSITINDKDRTGDLQFSPSEPLRLKVWGEAKVDVSAYRTAIEIFKDGDRLLCQHDAPEPGFLPKGPFEAVVEFPPYLLSPGEYSVTVGGYNADTNEWTWGTDQLRFIILEEWRFDYDTRTMGLINLQRFGERTSHSVKPAGPQGASREKAATNVGTRPSVNDDASG